MYRVYRGDVSKLTDVVRCQVTFPNLLKMTAFMNHLLELHKQSNIEILRIRNRLDIDYNAMQLTGGYRDCNLKIRVAFDLHKTDGAVMFMNVSRPQAIDEGHVKKNCCGLRPSAQIAPGNDEDDECLSELSFIFELQLILQVRCDVSHASCHVCECAVVFDTPYI